MIPRPPPTSPAAERADGRALTARGATRKIERMPPQSRMTLLALALTLVALLASACRAQQTGGTTFVTRTRAEAGEARSYYLGFSNVPWALTEQATRQTYDLAAHYGEVILVQRTPTWADFMPGAHPSATTREQLMAIRDATRGRGLLVAVVIDPFDPTARDRLQRLPASHAGKDFASPELRHAFVQEAVFIAKTLRPAYLGLGSEVNATFERSPGAHVAFVAAYREAYDAVKAASPETRVFPSFQYEELLGVIPNLPPHPPRWQLLKEYEGKMDVFGITTYPSFAYNVARKVPPTYYSAIREQTPLPIAFISVGYASGPSRDNLNTSTPPEQRRFLQRLLEEASLLGSPLVVWFAERDLSFATAPPYDLLASLGLRDIGDRPKESWSVWEAASNRRYDPQAAEAARLRRAREAAGGPGGEPPGSRPLGTPTP